MHDTLRAAGSDPAVWVPLDSLKAKVANKGAGTAIIIIIIIHNNIIMRRVGGPG